MCARKINNFFLALYDQLPLSRAWRNFVITRNAWGLFHKNSHVAQGTGKPKVSYGSKESAIKAAESMKRKYGNHYSPYKCIWCDGFHIGKNRHSETSNGS